MDEIQKDATEQVAKEKPGLFVLDNGQEASRSAFIRQEFLKDRSRSDIAKELDVPYYIVYTATANMFNAAHPEGGGGRVGSRGVMIEDPETGETIARAELMRRLFAKGMTRTELKDKFDVPYATVYAATKEIDAPEGARKGGRVMVEHPVTGEQVSRVDLIRELYASGQSRREIADQLKCDYSAVWAATKDKPTDKGTEEAAASAGDVEPEAEVEDLNFG